MLAFVLDHEPHLRTDYPAPVRSPGEALIRMRLAGVCDTDLQLAKGYMAFRGVLGHEAVGCVIEADDPTWVGQRVVCAINAGCGVCDQCVRNEARHCEQRTVLGIAGRDGVFAEQFVMPERCLVKVPATVSDAQAVFAEPLAAALHVQNALTLPAGARVLVLGDGKLGQLIVRALRSCGYDLAMAGHHRQKLASAEAAGARALFESDLGDARRYDAVVEASGSASGVNRALQVVRPQGLVVLKTTVAGAINIDWSPIVVHELRVIGSRCGSIAEAVHVLDQQALDLQDLVSATFDLEHADEAFECAWRKGVLKVLIRGTSYKR